MNTDQQETVSAILSRGQQCSAPGCIVYLRQSDWLMCQQHLSMVPPHLIERLKMFWKDTYGNSATKRTPAFLLALKSASQAVYDLEQTKRYKFVGTNEE